MSYFRAAFAVIPSRVLYLDGVQLSYIKVYAEIYNLWNAEKPCFLGNPELSKRTETSERTVKEALKFFEDRGELKRVQKGTRRFIVQPTRVIEIESVDNSASNCSNIARVGEIAPPPRRDSSPQVGELAPHKDKILNTKSNKSFCPSDVQKANNSKKHDFAEKPKAPLADVTKQSTSARPIDPNAPLAPLAPWFQALLDKKLVSKGERNEPAQFPAPTTVQSEMAQRPHSGSQGSQNAATG
jgi:hypothetical protein